MREVWARSTVILFVVSRATELKSHKGGDLSEAVLYMGKNKHDLGDWYTLLYSSVQFLVSVAQGSQYLPRTIGSCAVAPTFVLVLGQLRVACDVKEHTGR